MTRRHSARPKESGGLAVWGPWAIWIGVLLVPGCSTKATFQVPQSAEAPVRVRQRLVVLPVEGPGAPSAAAHGRLVDEVRGANYYQLIAPQQLQSASRVPLFGPNRVDRHAAVNAARREQLDLLLFSRLRVEQPNAVPLGDALVQFGSETVFETQLEYELVDVRSGRIVFQGSQPNRFQGELRQVSSDSHEAILERLAVQSGTAVGRKLVPHREDLAVSLKRAWWGRSGSHVRKGITAAQAGNWTAAETQWRKAIELEPKHAVAHYNLAVSQEAQGRYADAMKHYDQALQFAGSMDTTSIQAARLRVGRHQQQAQRIAWQTRMR